MGKKGAGTGVNTKVQAAREKQAAVEGAKAAKAQAAQEAAEAKEWSKGANQRGSKREDDAARKQEEKASKLAAKKALQAEEAEQLSGLKSVVVSLHGSCDDCPVLLLHTCTQRRNRVYHMMQYARPWTYYSYYFSSFEY